MELLSKSKCGRTAAIHFLFGDHVVNPKLWEVRNALAACRTGIFGRALECRFAAGRY